MSPRNFAGQRGFMKTGCLVALGVVGLVVLILAFTFVGRYNTLVAMQEKVAASWSLRPTTPVGDCHQRQV